MHQFQDHCDSTVEMTAVQERSNHLDQPERKTQDEWKPYPHLVQDDHMVTSRYNVITVQPQTIAVYDVDTLRLDPSPATADMDFERLKRPPSSSPRQQTRITNLPNEILQHIGDLAHPADRTSLAITNHRICNALGMHHLRPSVWPPSIHKALAARFLISLQRDLDGYTACLQCLKLHRQVDVQAQHNPSQPFQILTDCDRRDGGHRICPHYLMTPRTIRSAFLAKTRSPSHLDHSCGVKLSPGQLLTNRVSAQITDQGRLLIKTEYCMQLKYYYYIPVKDLKDALCALPQICPHDQLYDSLCALCCCVVSHKLVQRWANELQRPEFEALVARSRRETDQVINLKHLTPAERLTRDCKHAASLLTGLSPTPLMTSHRVQTHIQKSLEEAHAPFQPSPPTCPSSALNPLIPKQESWTLNTKTPTNSRKPNVCSHHIHRYFCTCNPCTVHRYDSASRVLCGAREEASQVTSSPCGRCVATRRCLFCPTEIYVTAPNSDKPTQSGFKLKIECWEDFGPESEAHAFGRTFLSHRIEPPVEGGWYREGFDPRKPYLYPIGGLKKAFEMASEETRAGGSRGARQAKARKMDLDSEMKAVLQDVRLPPCLTRYI